jgi:hypothetical protein
MKIRNTMLAGAMTQGQLIVSTTLSNVPLTKPTRPWGKTPRQVLAPNALYANGSTLRITGVTAAANDLGSYWNIYMVINDDQDGQCYDSGSVLVTTACQ